MMVIDEDNELMVECDNCLFLQNNVDESGILEDAYHMVI